MGIVGYFGRLLDTPFRWDGWRKRQNKLSEIVEPVCLGIVNVDIGSIALLRVIRQAIIVCPALYYIFFFINI